MAILQTLRNKRRWYTRQIDRPWEEGGVIQIIVRGTTTDRSKSLNDYYNDAVVKEALVKICDFYGKEPKGEELQGLMGTFFALVQAKGNVHWPSRPNTRPRLLIMLEKEALKALPKKNKVVSSLAHSSRSYPLKTLEFRIKAISGMFSNFQEQSKMFDGRTAPSVNFVHLHNELAFLLERIKLFLKFNGLDIKDLLDTSLLIDFAQDYRILDIAIIHRGQEKYLPKGTDYFLKDSQGFKNKNVNRILHDLNQIYSLRNNPPTWSDFIRLFMPEVRIDLCGRPQTLTESERIENRQKENNPMWMSEEELAVEEAELNSTDVKIKMMNEALAAGTEKARKKMDKDLSKMMEKVKEIEDGTELVREVIHKYGINHLIEAALECLVIKTGFAPPNMPNILGLNPYGLRPPALMIEIPAVPAKLPVVDISKKMGEEIKKGLERAAMEALLETVQVLADLIVSLCRGAEDEQIGDGQSLNTLIDDFPSPTASGPGKEDGAAGGLASCYEDYAIDPEVGNMFLEILAENITPRESCDLINGAPSLEVLEIIGDILTTRSEFALVSWREGDPVLQEIFIDNDVVIDFFLCVGNLISPDYCEKVYQLPPIDVSQLDPCTIEDLLIDQLDPDIFDELIDAYNNPEENFIPQVEVDMSCGAGIVPSLVDDPSFNHSITTMMNTIFEIPRSTFSSEISGLQSVMAQPKPGCSEKNAKLLEALERAGSLPSPRPADPEEGPDAAGQEFLSNIFGPASSALAGNQQVASVQALIDGIAGTNGAPGCNSANIEYQIAPRYQQELEEMDTKISTSWMPEPPETALHMWGADYENMYLQLATYGGPFGFTPVYMLFVPGSVGADPTKQESRVIMRSAPAPHTMWSGARQEANREWLGNQFIELVYNDYSVHQGVGGFATGYDGTHLRQGIKSAFYFPAYKSLLNSLAFNVRKSELFTPEGFAKLSLLPQPCPGDPGKQMGADLFDINTIIQEGLDEFADNACSDRTCVVGPVEDALIFAVTNAYIQVLLVEQLVKNIFMIDVYGLGDFITEGFMVDKILSEAHESLARNPTAAEALKDAAVIYVEKLRIRLAGSGQAQSTEYFVPHPNPNNNSYEEIASTWSIEEGVSPGDVDPGYRSYALDYMIRRRLANTIPAFSAAFPASGANANIAFVKNGLPVNGVLDFPRVNNWDKTGTNLQFSQMLQDADPTRATMLRLLKIKKMDGVKAGNNLPTLDYNYGRIRLPLSTLGDAANEADFNRKAFETVLADTGIERAENARVDETSQDEADLAQTHGLFAREKYVKLDFNFQNWWALNASVGGFTEFQNKEMYKQLKPLLMEQLGIPLGPGMAEPYYDPHPGDNTFVVSIDRFNNFINSIRQIDTRAGSGTDLSGITVRYMFNPTSYHSDQVDDRRSNAKLRRSPLYRFTWDKDGADEWSGLGGPEPLAGNYAYRPENAGGQGYGPFNRSGETYRYREVRGPLTRKNYDAIRFWINEVQGGRAWADNGVEITHENFTSRSEPDFRPSAYSSLREPFPMPKADHTWYNPTNMDQVAGRLPDGSPNTISGLGTPPGSYPYRAMVSDPLEWGTDRRDTLREVPKTYYEPGDTMARTNPLSERYSNFNGRIRVDWGSPNSSVSADGIFGGELKYKLQFADMYDQYDPVGEKRFVSWWNASWWFDLPSALLANIHAAGMSFIEEFGRPPPSGFPFRQHYEGSDARADDPRHHHYDLWQETKQWIKTKANSSVDLEAGFPLRVLWKSAFVNHLSVYSVFFNAVGGWRSMSEIANATGPSHYSDRASAGVQSLWYGSQPITAIWLTNPVFAEMMKEVSWDEYQNLTNTPAEIDMGIADAEAAAEAAPDAPPAVGNLTGIPAYDTAINSVIKNIRIGTRIVYNSPVMSEGNVYAPLLDSLAKVLGGATLDGARSLKSQDQLYYRDKSGYFVDNGDGVIWNVNTGIQAEVKVADGISDFRFTNQTAVGFAGEGEGLPSTQYVDYRQYDVVAPLFEAHEDSLIATMVNTEQYQRLFDTVYSAKNLLMMLFMFGFVITESSDPKLRRLFDDTKQSLRIILRAALAGKDYAYEDVEAKTASEMAMNAGIDIAAAGAEAFVTMGFSFILKMLIETPKGILMGLAEMIDPHVTIGKQIKDVSAGVIQMGEVAFQAAQAAGAPELPLPPDPFPGGSGAAGCDPSENPGGSVGSLVELIQTGIDLALFPVPKPLRPEVSQLGLNMIGRLPWIFAVPPGPLGVAYILLSLKPTDIEQLFPPDASTECCDDYQPVPPPPALPAPAGAEEDEIDVTSTYDCQD